MTTIWFVPMPNDTRQFDTPEGQPITVDRTAVSTVWVNPDRPEWTEISYAGRVRLVKADAGDVLAWVRGGDTRA